LIQVQLKAPSALIGIGYTTPAAVRRSFVFLEVGGFAGMNADPFSSKWMRNYPKLSWKSTTCGSWPRFISTKNRIAGGLKFSPLAVNLIFPNVKDQAPER
jgi:hypothetical protein